MLSRLKSRSRLLLQSIGILLYHAGLARWIINRSKRTRVVLYHAVEEQPGSYTAKLGMTLTPDIFALHLDYFQKFYNVISMDELLDEERSRGPSELLITFDDGYASVMDQALPLLEARKMKATTYLIGRAVRGQMIWVNRLNQALNDFPVETFEVLDGYGPVRRMERQQIIHYVQTRFEPMKINRLIDQLESSIPDLTRNGEKLFLNPEDIRQMQHRGMAFGFHSNDHWNLGRCKDSELQTTLSTQGLESLLNSDTFAYPFGYFAPSSIGRLSRKGYKLLLTVGNNNDRFSDRHLDRTEIFDESFASIFSRLEVEEPIMAAIRRWAFYCKGRLQQRFSSSKQPAV